MAQHLIFTFQLRTNEYAPAYPLFTVNRWVKVYWDDVTESVRVYLSNSSDPTGIPVGEALTGPYIPGTPKVSVEHGADRSNPGYSFCDGSTLVNHRINITVHSRSSFDGPYDFPYVIRTETEDHWSCNIHQCDLDFDLLATDVTEDSGASDGSVLVSAETTAGPPKFTMNPNATYASGDAFLPTSGNSYTFTGLPAGTYTIYALDSFNCKAQLTVIIPVAALVYGVRWRLLFEDIKVTSDKRVDIEERDYTGEIIIVQMTGDPVIRDWRGEAVEDVFNTIIAHTISINLISSTDFQFQDLFTQDERKFRVKSYREDALNGMWFVTPMLYSEPYYTKENYPVSITATDQIGMLKDLDFVDDFGNLIRQQISFLQAICTILRKTNITLDIFEAVNIYAVGMDGTPMTFANPSFEDGIMTPWISITNGEIGYPFSWLTGNYLTSDPPGGSFSGTPAISQSRPNSIMNWPSGDYAISVNVLQLGAAGGIEMNLYGFDDEYGSGMVNYGLIGTIPDSTTPVLYSATLPVTEKKYLGIGFVRIGAAGLHQIVILDAQITESPSDLSASSPLQQCFIDASVYIKNGEPLKCDEVLNSLLASFGARIYQARGYWIVESIEQKTGTVNYRTFNLQGELQDTGTIYSTIDIKKGTDVDRLAYRDRSGLLTILPSYNKIKFNIALAIDNSLLAPGFEKENIIENQSGNPEIIGWTYDMTNGDGIGFGIETLTEETKNDSNSKGALFVDFTNCEDYKEIIIISEQFDLSPVTESNLVISFDVYFRPIFSDIVNYIELSVKIGDNYLLPQNVPNDNTDGLIDGEYLRLFFNESLNWSSYKKTIYSRLRTQSQTLEGPVTVKLRISNNKLYDFASIADLRDAVTINSPIPKNLTQVKVLDGDFIRFYKIQAGTEADSSPDIIRPDDYVTHLWKLDKTVETPEVDFWLNGLLLDNVKMGFDVDFPESLSYETENNSNIKQNFVREIVHTDLALYPEDILETPVYNTNIQRLTNNWIRFSDGSPTSLWYRGYSDEMRSLLDILMRMYQGQITSPSYKFSGSFDSDVDPSLFNLFREIRLNKKLLAMSLVVHDHTNEVEAELLELKTGADGEPPADIYEFTEEFTTEFES